MLRHRVIIDGRDLTDQCQSITFSNVDPGGFEVLQSEELGSLGVRAGAPAAVLLGGNYAWHGRINEKGEVDSRNDTLGDIAAVGYGAKLTGNPYSMVYVDRDLSRWTDASRARQVALTGTYQTSSPQVVPDATSGLPALDLQVTGPASTGLVCDFQYDAGQGNRIGALYYDSVSTVPAGWQKLLMAQNTDDWSATTALLDLVGVNSQAGYLTVVGLRFLGGQLYSQVAVATAAAYDWFLRNLAVYGTHGLPRRGVDPGGLYASDIAVDAAKRSQANFALIIKDDTPFIVPHYVQYTPVNAEIVVGDMAKLQGYHWGVWEPATLDDRPTFLYSPPPAEPTCQVSRRDCTGFQAPSIRYDNVYDTAIVAWRDTGGATGLTTTTLAHPLLLPGESRTLQLDMGTGSAAAAAAFGAFALRLSQQSARGGGSAILPAMIALPGGGFKPSSLLRAGRDRIRLLDLRDRGALLNADMRGLDTFLIRRVETTVQPNGVPETRIEFDGGADLMEVLNARLATAAVIAGA